MKEQRQLYCDYESLSHGVSLDCRTEEMVKILDNYAEPEERDHVACCAAFERARILGRIDEFSDWDNTL